ncbi:unnamed protein product [Cuscuta campestris]|uniref:Pulmonary surfactant-associated protein B n=1 Tax=Cuscuta campestris TaxID=132261 RepID=A0A484MLD6_9ASTE|nr:unnamed protein product [Cuscuta campestris]
MDMKACLIIFILGVTCNTCSARDLAAPYLSTEIVDIPESGILAAKEASGSDIVCKMCEEFTTEAITYLNNNKTQEEIINLLLKSCPKLRMYEKQCVTLVNYYGPLFFVEVSSVEPEQFCKKAAMCQKVTLTSQKFFNNCNLCHQTVSEALLKLKDPDTQLEILELLLKACDSAKNYSKKCKQLVFEYAPVILVNAEQFLEANDICTAIHACDGPEPETDASMHFAS